MLIEYDYDFFPDGALCSVHCIDTADPGVLDMFAALEAGTISMESSGWGVISKHPDYPGKTRYEVATAQMKAKGDTAAIARLGL